MTEDNAGGIVRADRANFLVGFTANGRAQENAGAGCNARTSVRREQPDPASRKVLL